ncbi:MAG: hypothetical protein QM754_14750 [Tepidisphaeraceae bacterium]
MAVAQNPTEDQLQDLRNQLKRLQDGKNELATENAKLRQQIADKDKKLTEQSAQIDSLQNRAYYLREFYAVWTEFLEMNPNVRSMWSAYSFSAEAVDRATQLLGDRSWPFLIEG